MGELRLTGEASADPSSSSLQGDLVVTEALDGDSGHGAGPAGGIETRQIAVVGADLEGREDVGDVLLDALGTADWLAWPRGVTNVIDVNPMDVQVAMWDPPDGQRHISHDGSLHAARP